MNQIAGRKEYLKYFSYRPAKRSALKNPDKLIKLDYLLAKQKQQNSKSKTKYNSKVGVMDLIYFSS